MSEKRVQLNNIVKSQLPNYVRDEFPLIEEFLEQYYIAQEFQGAPVDLIQNIDKYIKIDETTNLTESAFIGVGIDEFDETITVSGSLSPKAQEDFLIHTVFCRLVMKLLHIREKLTFHLQVV